MNDYPMTEFGDYVLSAEEIGELQASEFKIGHEAGIREGARRAMTWFADEHERIADSIAITYQDPKAREAATWPHRWLVHIMRTALDEDGVRSGHLG